MKCQKLLLYFLSLSFIVLIAGCTRVILPFDTALIHNPSINPSNVDAQNLSIHITDLNHIRGDIKYAKHICIHELYSNANCSNDSFPVCGWIENKYQETMDNNLNVNIKCRSEPCIIEFNNVCDACKQENIGYWTYGNCPDNNSTKESIPDALNRLNPPSSSPEKDDPMQGNPYKEHSIEEIVTAAKNSSTLIDNMSISYADFVWGYIMYYDLDEQIKIETPFTKTENWLDNQYGIYGYYDPLKVFIDNQLNSNNLTLSVDFIPSLTQYNISELNSISPELYYLNGTCQGYINPELFSSESHKITHYSDSSIDWFVNVMDVTFPCYDKVQGQNVILSLNLDGKQILYNVDLSRIE